MDSIREQAIFDDPFPYLFVGDESFLYVNCASVPTILANFLNNVENCQIFRIA